ncbi:unnamed protein product, partial [Linum tenue]
MSSSTELLNRLLPRHLFHIEPKNRAFPVLELQVSVFTGGGVALGWACSHKLADAATMRSFLKTFCVVSCGDPNGVSRIEVLSCLIWKCSMAASRALSGSRRTSIMVEAVNLQDATDPPLPDSLMENVFWWATAPADESSVELQTQRNEAIGLYKGDYARSLQVEEGFE